MAEAGEVRTGLASYIQTGKLSEPISVVEVEETSDDIPTFYRVTTPYGSFWTTHKMKPKDLVKHWEHVRKNDGIIFWGDEQSTAARSIVHIDYAMDDNEIPNEVAARYGYVEEPEKAEDEVSDSVSGSAEAVSADASREAKA